MHSKAFIFAALAVAAASAVHVPSASLQWRDLSAGDKHVYTYDHFTAEFGKQASDQSRAIFAGN